MLDSKVLHFNGFRDFQVCERLLWRNVRRFESHCGRHLDNSFDDSVASRLSSFCVQEEECSVSVLLIQFQETSEYRVANLQLAPALFILTRFSLEDFTSKSD